MAFYDDRKFILSHIRHSFITCDDTGMCEMVMLNESMQNHYIDDPDSDFLKSIIAFVLFFLQILTPIMNNYLSIKV
jgi:hypothetical protein